MPMNPRLLRPLAKGRTFYFNAAVNGNWATLSNWWMNSAHTIPATGLPTSADDVVAFVYSEPNNSLIENSGSVPTVANLTVGQVGTYYLDLNMEITVTGVATFLDTSGLFESGVVNGNAVFDNYAYCGGTVNGNATFNDGSYVPYSANVTGTATFNDNSYIYSDGGTVTGNATFNDSSYNEGTVNGDATFNGTSFNNYGTVTEDATFNDNSYNYGTVSGNATFNGSSSNDGVVTLDATFNGSSYSSSYGTVDGNATFNGSSYNASTVTGTATFTGSACNVTGAGTAGTFVPNPPPSCP